MKDVFDIIIIGGGCAAASAALTARNRGKSIAAICTDIKSTGLYKAELISNYPGLPPTPGKDLAELFYSQLCSACDRVIVSRALNTMDYGGMWAVSTPDEFISAKALILATGITREKLYPGEAGLLGKGVSYCATCDGMLYRGKTVALIGSNAEAEQDAAFLEKIGCTVLRFTAPSGYVINGTDHVESLSFGGDTFPLDAVFIIKDTISVTQLVAGLERGKDGIVTSRSMATNMPGVFAAGDCTGKPFQLAKAAGEGNIAALSACTYIDNAKGD